MQKQLDNLYHSYLEAIFSDKEIEKMIEDNKLSSPQLLDVETPRGNYLNSEFKVLFIGKETNDWFNSNERYNEGLIPINGQFEKYINSLKKLYKSHNIGVKYRSPIYLFIDHLLKKLNESKQTGMLLTELLRHDYNCKGLPQHLIEKLAYEENSILREEVEILKPNALIFLTGPSYDKHIKMTYPMAVFQECEGYGIRQVAVIENIPNIKKAVRIYHPDYHNRKGANFKHKMVELITKFLNE